MEQLMNDKELINQLIKNIVEPNNHNYINQYAKQPQNIHNIFTLKRIIEQRLSLNITDLDPNNLVDSQILAHYDYLKIVMFMKTRKEILEFNWAINENIANSGYSSQHQIIQLELIYREHNKLKSEIYEMHKDQALRLIETFKDI